MYYEKLEAQLVFIFPKSLIPWLREETLQNNKGNPTKSEPNKLDDDGQSSTSPHYCSSITQPILKPQLYLMWLPEGTLLGTQPLDHSSRLPKSTYFALNTSSDLPLPSGEIETPPEFLYVIDVHILFSNLSLKDEAYKTPHFEPIYKNDCPYKKYELKLMWFYLKSKETLDKLEDFKSLEISALFEKQPMRRLYWLFKRYQWLYWLAISYCYMGQFNTITAETAMRCCCKMSQELLEREKVYKYSKLTEEEANILCVDWENSNRNLMKNDFYSLILNLTYNLIFQWK
ncbi:uncharacterized protein LOC116843602 [Odontomachus brunneus]|uniref:uncharacterized protein LOC116843602 n=1 Tax=Odontomachus brunneus TaxID=486640 RepID=UPI0013F243A0|nr:uncharacterized protein LOC116843602 [Odontomachus brunneus]XP_032670017.1 uncharacterized protein LOC116843602 [Odontomachus brunneus]XP_032670018.1 uncharacterized protein LOC116843602 [Odontomachus brunneus]XP_032670019.1 uncharacterized protein LOC116843602 [Odontomachus brunneus]XP_032670020.1 uncharacterized protein LOC116843602 [Odontomachus brunneus]XP_032670021.1 uncharacterized protein LOC116843602 [Odontomachus brunneus]XP_032670022.1 uncharacterized protein LOC116843602 [Odonto